MKKYLILFVLLIGINTIQAQELPLKTQPVLWLRADMPGIDSAFWKNSIDSTYNAAMLNQAVMPDTCVFNYQISFSIDTSNTPFIVSNFYPAIRDKYTVFTVYQSADTASEYGLWQMQLDSNTDVKLSSTKTKNIRSYIRYSQNGSPKAIINSSSQSWNRVMIDSTICSFKLAGTDSFAFNGKFAEFIVFNNRLERIDNEKVHTYLSLKYGIGIYYLNYVNSQDSILWNYENDSTYKYDIVGLARDDSLGVYQKQTSAQGGNSALTMYFDSLKYYNYDNNTIIDNMNYALYGHNGDSINVFNIDTNNMFSYANLMKRRWKIALRGNSIHQKAFSIRMHVPDVDTGLTLKLIINQLADDDFNPAYCTEISPTASDTLGNYYFTNIYWDTDFSGEDIFTFSKLPYSTSTQRRANNNTDEGNEEDNNANDPVNQQLTYKLYPNPSNGNFVLDVSAINKSAFTMSIFDATGKRIWQNEYTGKLFYKIEQNISNSGSYLINLKSETVNENIKLIIK